MRNILRTRMFMHDYERMGAMSTEVINVPLYGSLSPHGLLVLYTWFFIYSSAVVSVTFDQDIYTVSESGSVTITLSLDRGIDTAFTVIVRPGS